MDAASAPFIRRPPRYCGHPSLCVPLMFALKLHSGPANLDGPAGQFRALRCRQPGHAGLAALLASSPP